MEACEPTQSPTLFSKSFLERLIRSTIRRCGICGRTGVVAGRSAPMYVEFSRTDSRTNSAPMWTTRGCSKFFTFCPQRFHPIPTLIHRCESSIPGHSLGVLPWRVRSGSAPLDPKRPLEHTLEDPLERYLEAPSSARSRRHPTGPSRDVRGARGVVPSPGNGLCPGSGRGPATGAQERRARSSDLPLGSLLDACSELLDLVVDLPALRHLFANLLVRIHDGGVVAAERLADLR